MDEKENAAYEIAVKKIMDEWTPPAREDMRDILRKLCEPDFLAMWDLGKQYGAMLKACASALEGNGYER